MLQPKIVLPPLFMVATKSSEGDIGKECRGKEAVLLHVLPLLTLHQQGQQLLNVIVALRLQRCDEPFHTLLACRSYVAVAHTVPVSFENYSCNENSLDIVILERRVTERRISNFTLSPNKGSVKI